MAANPLYFRLGDGSITYDLPPPPTADLRYIIEERRSVDGTPYYSVPFHCTVDAASMGTLPERYRVRFASGRNSGWITKDQAAWLENLYRTVGTVIVSTNITIPELSNVTLRFSYGDGGLTLVRAAVDDRYWLYDMMLKNF